jgi:glycosyltransferase involved in cell wall biosynthesis
MKSISVVHINAASSGGAYVAAERLSKAIDQVEGFYAEHWIFEYNTAHSRRWADSTVKKWYAIFLHALEKLDFLRFEKSKSVRFAFSHGKTGIAVRNWQVLKDADIIHLHWVNKGFISLQGLNELLSMGKPVFWTCHDMWPFTGGCYHPRGCENFTSGCGNCQYLNNPSSKDLSYKVFQEKTTLLSAENLQLVTPSDWLKKQAIQRSHLQLVNQISVIPNPMDIDFFCRESLDSIELRKKQWGVPLSARVLLFISANLSNPKKGFNEFVIIANSLEQTHPGQWFSLVVGDRWPEHVTLSMPYVSLGLLSTAEDIRWAYGLSDLYVTTSHEENLPTTIMEAQCMGLPVAAFGIGGIPEMISEDLGYCGEFMDLKGMVGWIKQWAALGEIEQRELSSKNRAFASVKYGEDGVASSYCELYNRALNIRK